MENEDYYEFDFFDNILYYDRNKSQLYKLIDSCKKYFNYDSINCIINKPTNINKFDSILSEKNNEIINSIKILTSENRFLQRFQYPKFIDSTVCDWIINEAESKSVAR